MQLIKKLDIYIFKNFLMLFIGTFCISLFVVLLQFSWRYIDELVGKGLELSVLAKFFWYATLYLVPTALPLAVLLASLISFSNMGEKLELLAIKAAGIPLFRTIRPIMIFSAIISGVSFYFQDVVVPDADNKFMQLYYAITIKSPELDIPEGVFYDGIEGNNIYVAKKNKETGMMYNVIIYNFQYGSSNAHIILADSARIETSATKTELLLHLYNGEQFENTDNTSFQPGSQRSNVPYRRETFVEKHFIIDFDTNLNTDNNADFNSSAKTKSIEQMVVDIDSLKLHYDSCGMNFYKETRRISIDVMGTTMSPDSAEAAKILAAKLAQSKAKSKAGNESDKLDIDTLFASLGSAKQQSVVMGALQRANIQRMNSEWWAQEMKRGDYIIKSHIAEIYQKITMSLACLIFFFVGAPLGAIIRKGGIGMPVVVAVLIFIFYYIINNAGVKVGREGVIPVELGVWLSTIILTPLGLFLTIKANNDSAVFNMDTYVAFFRKLWGIRQKRHIVGKEVIINDPDYEAAEQMLDELIRDAKAYLGDKKLKSIFYFIKLFIGKADAADIESITQRTDLLVDVLSNSKKRQLIVDLNYMPIIDYRSFRFYRRVRKDMKDIIKTGDKLKTDIYGK